MQQLRSSLEIVSDRLEAHQQKGKFDYNTQAKQRQPQKVIT